MIGFIIPTHSRLDALSRALASIEGHPVVVVDDSPEGLTLDAKVPRIRTAGEEGFAAAVNYGLAHWESHGVERVIVLNDDAAMAPGSVAALAAAWTSGDGALAPVVHEPDGAVYGIDVLWGGRIRVRRAPGDAAALSGAVLMLRSSERFDPAYRHGFEDIELCGRLRARGLRVRVVESASATHAAGATVSRRSRAAQRAALQGHLRWAETGPKRIYAVALSVAQVAREGGPADRLLGVVDAVREHLGGTALQGG